MKFRTPFILALLAALLAFVLAACGSDPATLADIPAYDGATAVSGKSTHVRNLVRGGLSWYLGKWYVDVTGDYYFGEEDDVYTIGLYLSHRF